MKAYNKKTEAIIQEMKSWREETKLCPQKWQANAEGKKAVAERQEVPNDWAATEMIGAVKDRSGTDVWP
jgi:hypothetical protein